MEEYWTDKSGKKHLITEMSNEHIENTIEMLERNRSEPRLVYGVDMTDAIVIELPMGESERVLREERKRRYLHLVEHLQSLYEEATSGVWEDEMDVITSPELEDLCVAMELYYYDTALIVAMQNNLPTLLKLARLAIENEPT